MKKINKRKIWIFPLPIAIAILFVLFGGGALIYALTKTTEKAGPVGYWKFDEGAGTIAYDASGNNNNGTLTNFDFNDNSNWTAGKVAGAIKFDGSNDYVNVGSSTVFNIASEITVEAWFKAESYPQQYNGIVTKTDVFELNLKNDNTFDWWIKTTGWQNCTTTGVSLNQWTHYVATYDGSNMKIYGNGSLIKTCLATGAINSSTNIVAIGARPSVTQWFNGTIDDVRIYNRALSAAEVSWNYNRGGPVGWWKFDEGTGSSTVAYDSSGNGNNGAIYGASSTAGKINSALSFNGTSDYVDVGNSSVLRPTTAVTLELWAKPGATGEYLVSMPYLPGWSSPFFGYTVYYEQTQQRVYFAINIGGVENSFYTAANSALIGQWYHIVLAFNGTTLKGYINGVEVKSQAAVGSIAYSGSPKLAIGSRSIESPGEFGNATIDDVRIYNYARSASEIRTDYNSGFAVKFGGDSAYDLSRGLVGYWDLDEGAGTKAYDSTLNGNNGTLTNFDFNDTSNWTNGKVAGALKFDGSNDYVDLGNSTTLQPNEFTLAAWIKGVYSPSTEKFIISRSTSTAAKDAHYIFYTYAGKLRFHIGNGVTANSIDPASETLTDNQWYHVVAVLSSTTLRVYINGIQYGTTTTRTIDPNVSAKTIIGANVQGTVHFQNGYLDDVRIYNRALSADEIRYLYNRKGPVGWWKFDEGTASTTFDSSGNGNTGIWSGTGTHWTTGKINSAGQFASTTSDYVNAGNDAILDITSAITVEAWIKTSSNASYMGIVSKRIAWSANDFEFQMTSGRPRFTYNTGNKDIYAATTPNVRDGNWHHIVATLSGTTETIYIDGIQNVQETDGEAIVPGTQNLFIGRYAGGVDSYFTGLIDDVRIYNYARTAAEIRTDYNSGFAVKFGGSYDLTQGLVGYWSFGEGSGSVAYDVTENNNDGTLNNFVFDSSSGWTSGNAAANTGGALKFDGVDDSVDAGDGASVDITGTNISIGLWVKVISFTTTPGDYDSLVSKMNSGASSWQYSILINYDGTIYSTFADLSIPTTNLWAASLNTWQYIVLTYDGSWLKAYKDGVKIIDVARTGSLTSSNRDLVIGNALAGGSRGANAVIDDVRIYNHALSADEIRYLYNRKQPIAHWKFDEGTGQSAFDSSINGNTGQLGSTTAADAGDPTWTDGKWGRALSFDGIDDRIAGLPELLAGKSAVTLEAWINPDVINSWRVAVGSSNGGGAGNSGALVAYDPGGSPSLYFDTRTTSGRVNTATALNASVWTHAVGVYDGSNIYLYKNGVLAAGPIAQSGAFVGTDVFSIGSGTGSSLYFDGLIDDVRIYNYARTASEIRADYNAGMSTYFK